MELLICIQQICQIPPGSVSINGTLKTSSPKGLYGTGQSTVTGGTISLNNNSTIEYNANGDQDCTGERTEYPLL